MLKGISPTTQTPEQQQAAVIDKRDPKVLEAAKMYEQAFLKQMVGAMRQAVPKSDLVNESMGERIYKDQMYDNYVEQWSNVGGVGLGDMIYDQIIERFGPQQKNIKPMGPIPLDQGKTFQIESQSDKPTESGHQSLLLKFKPKNNFEPMQIISPYEGEVIGSNTLENGQKALFLKHPNDMKSTFVFNGSLNATKKNFGPGEQIGTVSLDSNEFLWKLEGKKV